MKPVLKFDDGNWFAAADQGNTRGMLLGKQSIRLGVIDSAEIFIVDGLVWAWYEGKAYRCESQDIKQAIARYFRG